MSLARIKSWQAEDSLVLRQSGGGGVPAGHDHFWERATSRGQFIRTATGAFGALLTAGIWMPELARAGRGAAVLANPIPGGIQPFGPGTEVFHVFLPEPGNEPSTITDFDGHVAIGRVTGFGTKTDPDGSTSRPFYDADMRFMTGLYVGVDGRHHTGSFGFF